MYAAGSAAQDVGRSKGASELDLDEVEERRIAEEEEAQARALVGSLEHKICDDESDSSDDDDDDGERTNTMVFAVDGRATTYQAELRVLDAIAAPRKSLAKEGVSLARAPEEKPWLTPAEADLERRMRPDYLSMTKAQLESFRPEVPIDEEREQLEQRNEHAHVRTLPRQPAKAESSTGLSMVKEMSKSRQIRHDEALRAFKEKVALISDDLETRVIDQGRDLRDRLESVDESIRKVVLELRDEQSLRMRDYDYVCEAWARLERLCEKRKTAILDFDAELEAVEETRTARTSHELSALVEGLVSISYKLQGEIARLAEREAHEINLVVINNLKIKKDLSARMLKHQVSVFHSTRAHWEKAETRWRFLRHQRALDEWVSLMKSEDFSDPPRRKALIERAQETQRTRHLQNRLELVDDLRHLVPDLSLANDKLEVPHSLPNLTWDRVEETRQRLVALDETEKLACEDLSRALEDHHQEMRTTMEQTREALRAELHEYAALADEGDIFTQGERGKGALHRIRLHELATDDSLDDFFRRAGGLKSELTTLISALAKPELIHNEHLESLLHRVELLVEARQVAQVHEDEGKASDLKALQGTLEKLRIGATSDLAPLVRVLHRQAGLLHATVASLGDFLSREILAAIRLLEQVDPSLVAATEVNDDAESGSRNGEDEYTADPNGAGLTEDGIVAQASHVTSLYDADQDDAEGPGSRATAAVLDPNSAELAYKAKPLNLVDLRAAQKLLGTVVHASGLPCELCDELERCRDTLRIQVQANKTVDEIIGGHCEMRIAQRESEIASYREELCERTRQQNELLAANAARLCDFVAAIARVLQQAREGEDKTDVYYENALDQLADRFEDDDARREGRFTETVDRVRHAPDKASLQENFEEALQILGEIDAGYRAFHQQGVKLSREHPARAHQDAMEQHCRIAEHFGFVHVTDATKDETVSFSASEQNPSSSEGGGPEDDSAVTADADEDSMQEGAVSAAVDDDIVDGDAEAEASEANGEDSSDPAGIEDDGNEDPLAEKNEDVSVDEDQNEEAEEDKLIIVTLNGKYAFQQQVRTVDLAAKLLKPPNTDIEDEEGNEDDARNDDEDDDVESLTEGETGAIEGNEDEETAADGNEQGAAEGEEQVVRDSQSTAHESHGSEDDLAAAEERDAAELDSDASYLPTPTWPTLEIGLDVVTPLLERVRNAVLRTTCEFRAAREKEMEALCKERCEDYTEELEERLRLHWPRKGRTDVKFQQPRAGELLQHQQRHDRHVRAVQLKNSYQGQQFQRKVAKVQESLRKFKQYMNSLRLHLEAQSNAAALQGLSKKAKDAAAAFKTAMDDEKDALMPFVRRNNDLLDMNRQFLSTCIPFEGGGDYNRDEIESERHALSLVEETLLRSLHARAEELQNLFTLIKDTRVTLSTELAQDFEQCLQALSVREGLGRKYGAPRRKAQERLRSETARSKSAETFIDNLLQDLEALIRVDVSDADLDEESDSLALRIKVIMDSLRKCTWRRAKYLEFLEHPETFPDPPPCALQDAADDALNMGMDEDAVGVAMGVLSSADNTFRAVVEEAVAQCCQDTTDLYEAEGMTSELLESGKRLTPDGALLPESLVLFLREFEEKGRQTQIEASRHLRTQIEKAQELFREAPAVVLGNLVARAQRNGATARETLESSFEDFYRRSERMRCGHRELLRPVMGDPNHKSDLEHLCSSEQSRYEGARERLASTHADILERLKEEADLFANVLKTTSGCLLELLDTTLLPGDLRALPGDDEVVTKRMGLRKLRKARLKAEAGETTDSSAESADLPRGLPRKTWPVLECSDLRALQGAFRPLAAGGGASGEDSDAIAASSSSASLSLEILIEAVETLSTKQHRAVVLERHRAYDAFVAWYRETCSTVDAKFRAMFQEEDRWAAYWQKQLEKLTDL